MGCDDGCPECRGNGYTECLGPNGLERKDCPRAGIDEWRNDREKWAAIEKRSRANPDQGSLL